MKLIRFVILTALLLCTTALSANAEGHSIVLPLSDCDMLISSAGEPLTARGAYLQIASISPEDIEPADELFMATPSYDEQVSGLSVLMDSRGEVLSDPVYDQLIHEGGVIRYLQNGHWGVMDTQLGPLVPCRYTVLAPSGEGAYLGLDDDPYDEKPDGVYYIDYSGQETATGARVVAGLGEFSEGLCTAVSADSGRVGYLSARGDWAIPAQLEYGGDFKNGRAEACMDSGYGIIDAMGNWLLTPKYTLVSTGFGDGNIILASQGPGEVLLIDTRNYQVKKSFKGEDMYFGAYFDRDYVVLYTVDNVQLIDEDGDVLMTAAPDGNFDAWYAMGDRVIKRDGPWGEMITYLVSSSGQDIAGPYRDIALLGPDAQGEPHFAFFDFEVQQEAEGAVEMAEPIEAPGTRRCGVMDKDGNVVIEMGTFSKLSYAGGGYLAAETEAEVGLVDMKGEWLIKLDR